MKALERAHDLTNDQHTTWEVFRQDGRCDSPVSSAALPQNHHVHVVCAGVPLSCAQTVCVIAAAVCPSW